MTVQSPTSSSASALDQASLSPPLNEDDFASFSGSFDETIKPSQARSFTMPPPNHPPPPLPIQFRNLKQPEPEEPASSSVNTVKLSAPPSSFSESSQREESPESTSFFNENDDLIDSPTAAKGSIGILDIYGFKSDGDDFAAEVETMWDSMHTRDLTSPPMPSIPDSLESPLLSDKRSHSTLSHSTITPSMNLSNQTKTASMTTSPNLNTPSTSTSPRLSSSSVHHSASTLKTKMSATSLKSIPEAGFLQNEVTPLSPAFSYQSSYENHSFAKARVGVTPDLSSASSSSRASSSLFSPSSAIRTSEYSTDGEIDDVHSKRGKMPSHYADWISASRVSQPSHHSQESSLGEEALGIGGGVVGLGITSDEVVDSQIGEISRRRGGSLSQTGGMTALDMRRASVRGGLSTPQLKTLQARLEKAEEQSLGKVTAGYIPVPPSNLQPLLSPFLDGSKEKEFDFSNTSPRLRQNLSRSNTNPTTTLSTLSSESQRYSYHSGNSFEVTSYSSKEHHADTESEDDEIDPYNAVVSLQNDYMGLKTSTSLEPTAVVVAEEGRAVIADMSGESLFGIRLKEGTTHLLLRHTQTPELVLACLRDSISSIAQSLLVLDISNCHLQEIPKVLASCSALEELNVSSNPIDGLPPFLNRLSALRVLIADKCGLVTLYNDLSGLQNLHTFSLNDNALRALPAWLCHLPSIEYLFLDGNAFHSEWQKLIKAVSMRENEPTSAAMEISDTGYTSQTRSSASSISDVSISGKDLSPPSSAVEKPVQSPARSRLMSFGRSKARPELQTVASTSSLKEIPPIPQMKRMKSVGDMDLNFYSTTNSAATSANSSQEILDSNPPLTAPLRSNNSIPPTPSPLASSQPISYDSEDGGKGLEKDGKRKKWGFLRKMSLNTMNKQEGSDHHEGGRSRAKSFISKVPKLNPRPSEIIVEETVPVTKRRSFLLLHNNNKSQVIPSDNLHQDPSTDSNGLDYKAGLKAIIAYLQDLDDLTPTIQNNGQASISSPNLSTAPSLSSSSSSSGSSLLRTPSMRRDYTDTNSFFESSGRSTPIAVSDDMGFKCKADASRREKIIEELLTTEKNYLRQLKEMVEIYVKEGEREIVTPTGKKESIVPISERRTVFGNIDNIIHFHESVFLPNLESAVEILFIKRKADDPITGTFLRQISQKVARVFIQHSAFFKLYAPYINNFDVALSRLSTWTAQKPTTGNSSGYSMAKTMSSVGGVATLGMSGIVDAPGTSLSESQKKRLKAYLKKCKNDQRHSQVSLESYLLLPVQRIPRYKLLLDNLLSCTPIDETSSIPDVVIKEAAEIIADITADMNERKREAESRHRLLFWQQRIKNKFRSPLVQPHRRMLKEGGVELVRVVKRRSQYVDVALPSLSERDPSVGGTKESSLIQVHSLEVETETRRLTALLCSDILVLCKEPPDGIDGTGPIELYTVIRLSSTPGSKVIPVSMFGPTGTMFRIVDSRAILYLNCSSEADALTWVDSINLQMQ